MPSRSRSSARRLLLAAALAVAAGATLAACDRGTEPGHDHSPDGDFCGHVDNVGGCMLVSHGDTLCLHRPPSLTGGIEVLAGGLKHGIQVTFLDENLDGIPIANDCAINSMVVTSDDPDVAEVQREDGLRWYFNVQGKTAGSTSVRVSLRHDSHSHYTSPPIPVNVVPVE
jgi:hypothetical protein